MPGGVWAQPRCCTSSVPRDSDRGRFLDPKVGSSPLLFPRKAPIGCHVHPSCKNSRVTRVQRSQSFVHLGMAGAARSLMLPAQHQGCTPFSPQPTSSPWDTGCSLGRPHPLQSTSHPNIMEAEPSGMPSLLPWAPFKPQLPLLLQDVILASRFWSRQTQREQLPGLRAIPATEPGTQQAHGNHSENRHHPETQITRQMSPRGSLAETL